MARKKIKPSAHEEVKNMIIGAIIDGMSKDDVKTLVAKDFKEFATDEAFTAIWIQSVKALRETVLVDIDKIIPRHMELYEKIYKEFDEFNFVPGKLKALRQKEKLVGLHKETNYIEIQNEMNLEVVEEPAYDISKLTNSEQSRLKELMKRVTDGNRQAIRITT